MKWIGVPVAASLLGLSLHKVYELIDCGDLAAEVTVSSARPRSRRTLRLRRAAVDEYVQRSRVKPGELRHLYPQH